MAGDNSVPNPLEDEDAEFQRELQEMIAEALERGLLRGTVLCLTTKQDIVTRVVCAMLASGVATDGQKPAWEMADYRQTQVMLASMIADSILNECDEGLRFEQ